MRADRLLSLLILIQTRGTLTARDLAAQLEVSERTIYRDVEALSMAGVPVFAERGPGGGISLLEEYRTNLTGLTADEVQALFMLSIPSPLLALGVGAELKAALLKLTAALPESRLRDQQLARQRIHLDASWWGQSGRPGPHLSAAQQAVWQLRRLHIQLRTFFGGEIELVVEPLGLVAKASDWHLVALREARPRVYRVADLTGAEALPERFERPVDFDLVSFWEDYCRQVEVERGLYTAVLRISPRLAREFRWHLGEQAAGALAEATPPDERGWRVVKCAFRNEIEACARVLGLGGAAEVLEPEALRKSVIDFAGQILGVYGGGNVDEREVNE